MEKNYSPPGQGDQGNAVEGECANDDRPTQRKRQFGVIYTVNASPPWYVTVVLGLQHYLTMFGGTVSTLFVLTGPLCVDNNLVLKAEMAGTVFFVVGITTFLNGTFGIRLPIIQGTTASLLLPILSMTATMGKCPAVGNSTIQNYTEENIYPRIQMASGTLMVASVFQIFIGISGAVTLLLRLIGPLVITPTITLIGLSLFKIAGFQSQGQWWIAIMTSFLICIFTYFLARLRVPICVKDERCGKCKIKRYPIFQTCSVILAMGVAWIICAILTATDVLPPDPTKWGYKARTDTRIDVLTATPWFQFPYPTRWGAPHIYPVALLGLAAGFVASVVESVGDYYACARMAEAPPPPTFAVNRGMAIEGLGCFVAGMLGLPVGTTSYSENVGAIGMTRVGSRRVVQAAAGIMLLFGVIAKIGAVFVSIPDPIFGGVFITMFGMLTGVGMSNLQFVDLNSSRNLFVLGSALFLGMMLPEWVSANGDSIKTGAELVDTTLRILLTIPMFIGGLVAFSLDLILPGSKEERGIRKWRRNTRQAPQEALREEVIKTYDLGLSRRVFIRCSWMRYLPICPNYWKVTEQSPSNPTPETAENGAAITRF